MKEDMVTEKAQDWLGNISLEELFLQDKAAHILSRPDSEKNLEKIVASEEVEPRLRVLAHELLIEASHKVELKMVEVYCRTVPDTFLHNWWGMPGQYVERLGNTLTSFGEAALPCLYRLLDNKQPLDYFGSEEPTLSTRMHYRVCDLAAYFIASIAGVPYNDSEDPIVRDKLNNKRKHKDKK
jgi:hypothetical protein